MRTSAGGAAPAVRVRLRALFLLALLVGGTSLLFLISGTDGMGDLLVVIERTKQQYQSTDDSTIHTEGCEIPFMKPFDDSAIPFVKYPTIHCMANPLLQSNKTHIWVQQQNMHFYNISNNKSFTCCYKPFFRPVQIDDVTSPDTDKRVTYKDCQFFSHSIKVTDEFVRVICGGGTKKVFDTFFLFAIEKKLSINNDFIRFNKTLPYNVLILGIDGVSRLNFHRMMPKTVKYLYNLGAVDLLGYNKVGDNTFPNLMPMLLGRKHTELWETCVPNSGSSFDNCPFVWELFRRAGARTALAEDTAGLGTFNYARRGFLAAPTDYYTHTFMHQAETHAGYNKESNVHLCMNDKFFYRILLDYVEHLTTFESKLFGFFWETSMTHDFINYPLVMDDDYVNLLRKMYDSGYLNESIIFLVSDHGIRWGEFRSTKQGRFEERLPFVFGLMPHSFRNKYSKAYDNFKLNSRRLTTPFDMHATLSDLANIDNIENENIIARSKENYSRYRNISLFLPIPGNRTCKAADIDDHWCTCRRNVPVSRDSLEVREAADHVVWHLNDLLKNYPQCYKLAIVEILDATKMLADNRTNVLEWPEFTVVVRTEPGGGLFEGTLQRAGDATRSDAAGARWALAGSVSRLNLYGYQSQCASDSLVKLYCYCMSEII